MEFKKAYEALKQGHKIKREHWKGYWVKENGTITMHCKDGSVIPFLETEDIIYTKCENYQQEKKLEGYKRPIVKTAGRKLEI